MTVKTINPMSQAAARELAEKEEAARKRAARQAAKSSVQQAPDEVVQVRVLPMGADKISMGEHVAGIGEAHYERGEEFSVNRPIAEALQARGYVEIKTK
jgi:hypothetical protein